MRWKSRSIFQVLLQYRAVRYQDLVHFSQQVTTTQILYKEPSLSLAFVPKEVFSYFLIIARVQVHIYNQAVLEALLNTSIAVLIDRVDPQAKEADFLGSGPPTVWKLPFRIDQLQYYDTSYMCDPSAKSK